SRAASDCLVSQSTLSSAIKELETILDSQLVDRSTRHFSLTPAGKDVASRATKSRAETEEMARAAADRRPLEGPFTLGVIPTIAPFLLPIATKKLASKFPKLELFLREDLTAALAERLADGSIDAALMAFPYDLPGIEWIKIGEDPFFYAAPAGDPVASGKPLRSADLKESRLLLLEDGHCMRDHALDACKMRRDDVSGAFGATSLFTLTQMVRAGLGATLLPKMAVDAGLAANNGLIVSPLADPAPARIIGLAWRKGSGRREDCELLADHFTQSMNAASKKAAAR
ncbi:MAG: hydrogen peroxide-inducible genes activator, partial [Parvularculaceae bacterium]